MKEYVIYKPIIIILHTIIRILSVPFFKIFGDWKIYGKENLDKIKNIRKIIITSNHTNELDVFFVTFSIPLKIIRPPVYYVSKQKQNYNVSGWKKLIYGGIIFKILGGFPINKGTKDYSKALKTHLEIINNNNPLVIFPEGGISKNGKLQPARGGIGYLVHNSKAPVLPIAIKPIINLNPKDFFKRKYKIKIKIGGLIPYQEINKQISSKNDIEKYKQTANIIMDKIKNMLQDIS